MATSHHSFPSPQPTAFTDRGVFTDVHVLVEGTSSARERVHGRVLGRCATRFGETGRVLFASLHLEPVSGRAWLGLVDVGAEQVDRYVVSGPREALFAHPGVVRRLRTATSLFVLGDAVAEAWLCERVPWANPVGRLGRQALAADERGRGLVRPMTTERAIAEWRAAEHDADDPFSALDRGARDQDVATCLLSELLVGCTSDLALRGFCRERAA